MIWLELTEDGGRRCVNMNNATSFRPQNGGEGTVITFTGGHSCLVQESYDEVHSRMKTYVSRKAAQ